jgi:Glyoxalase/Bleomycin resistance protein/Dioxygenase superfamily
VKGAIGCGTLSTPEHVTASLSVWIAYGAFHEREVHTLEVPARGIQHVDLCVSDVERSLAFYLELLGPLGLKEDIRIQSYRGTEEVVYLLFGEQNIGYAQGTVASTAITTWASSTWPSKSTPVTRSTRRSSAHSS